MRLPYGEKTDEIFKQINEIQKASFGPYETAPVGVLREQFDIGAVFVVLSDSSEVLCYLILTEKWGEPYVWSVATKEAYRGKGLASSLIDEAIEYVKGIPAYGLGLTVKFDNPAQKLYFDKGFRVTNVLPRYYVDGDGLRMRREVI